MDHQTIIEKFHEIFQTNGEKGIRLFFSPGRINLIGEHTDYNGGHVFPCAISMGTYGVARKREDDLIRLYSLNFPETGMIQFNLADLEFEKAHQWANYPKGMIRYIQEAGWKLQSGLDILIYGNIPNGAGLSSSASLEMLIGVMLDEMFDLRIERPALIKLGQRVENEFIGVHSGIMDQFAIGMGKKDCGILLDCNTLTYKYAPIHLTNHQIIIMNTNKRRELSASKYNERRKECEAALAKLQQAISIQTLCELTEESFEQYKHLIDDDVLQRRAKHVVYENQRAIKAYHALNNGDLVRFGQYLNESHRSLKEDYEVTGVELDTLVEAAWRQKGILGARMTGAGFGGCAIAIVETEYLEEFIEKVGREYQQKIGYEASFYVASISDGTKEIPMEVL